MQGGEATTSSLVPPADNFSNPSLIAYLNGYSQYFFIWIGVILILTIIGLLSYIHRLRIRVTKDLDDAKVSLHKSISLMEEYLSETLSKKHKGSPSSSEAREIQSDMKDAFEQTEKFVDRDIEKLEKGL